MLKYRVYPWTAGNWHQLEPIILLNWYVFGIFDVASWNEASYHIPWMTTCIMASRRTGWAHSFTGAYFFTGGVFDEVVRWSLRLPMSWEQFSAEFLTFCAASLHAAARKAWPLPPSDNLFKLLLNMSLVTKWYVIAIQKLISLDVLRVVPVEHDEMDFELKHSMEKHGCPLSRSSPCAQLTGCTALS